MKDIMKKTLVSAALGLAVATAFTGTKDVQAAKKKVVTYSLKKGTLTIGGKGEMTKKFSNRKAIKKVVIKKGVKSISPSAFANCTNLKSIKISSSVKKIGKRAFENTKIKSLTIPKSVKEIKHSFIDRCPELESLTIPGNFKGEYTTMYKTHPAIVKFNSPLDLKTVELYKTIEFKTCNSDKKYKTYDGYIYTKDGKELKRVPGDVAKVNVRSGCESFDVNSILYGSYGENGKVCTNVSSINLPASINHIYDESNGSYSATTKGIILKIDNKSLPMNDISVLCHRLTVSIEDIAKEIPGRIKLVDDTYYVGDEVNVIGVAKGYKGKINIAENKGIKNICDYAFWGAINTFDIPSTVERVGCYAFANSDISKFKGVKSLKSIGKYAFYGTDYLYDIEIPDGVTVIEKGTFAETALNNIVGGNNIKEIQEEAFASTNVDPQKILELKNLEKIGDSAFDNTGWSKIRIPANIKTIGKNAFGNSFGKYAEFVGSVAGISKSIFGDECNKGLIISFGSGIKDAFTPFSCYEINKKKHIYKVEWTKVEDVTGYDIKVASNKKLTKNTIKFTAGYSLVGKKVTLNKKSKYVGVRPYKKVNGKKVYGKWMIKAL